MLISALFVFEKLVSMRATRPGGVWASEGHVSQLCPLWVGTFKPKVRKFPNIKGNFAFRQEVAESFFGRVLEESGFRDLGIGFSDPRDFINNS